MSNILYTRLCKIKYKYNGIRNTHKLLLEKVPNQQLLCYIGTPKIYSSSRRCLLPIRGFLVLHSQVRLLWNLFTLFSIVALVLVVDKSTQKPSLTHTLILRCVFSDLCLVVVHLVAFMSKFPSFFSLNAPLNYILPSVPRDAP